MDKTPYNTSQDVEVRKGPWTMEEDLILINYIANHGEGVWNSLAKAAGLKRTGKSCRLRWLNYLRPDVKRGNITPEEQLLIMELHAKWGNRWSKIAKHLPGRTDNEIKNYWRTRIQKHIKQGENFSGGLQNYAEINNDQQASSSSQMSGVTYNTMETYSPPSYQVNNNNNNNNNNNININNNNSINGEANFHHNHHHQPVVATPFPPEMMATTENYWSMEDLWLLNGD